jgi:hypothetical protein
VRRLPSHRTSGASTGASLEKNTYKRRKPRACRTDQRRTLYMGVLSMARRLRGAHRRRPDSLRPAQHLHIGEG